MNRPELHAYFQRVRSHSEAICKPLAPEDYVPQPIADVSPPKWHLGHTSWFYEAVFLQDYIPGYTFFNSNYKFIFNSYYESFGARVERPLRGTLSRPVLKEVLSYRAYIDEQMAALIEHVDETQLPAFAELLVLALNHEQQHQELLLTDLKYILACNPEKPTYRRDLAQSANAPLPALKFVPCTGGVHEIGWNDEGFAYDNEGPRHKVYTDDFALANRLVSNGEYLEFVRAGGYTDFRHWLEDGWKTVCDEGWQMPLYWQEQDGIYFEFTLGGLVPLDPAGPATHISYYEAEAFAQWSGQRLPSEAEWEIAARQHTTSAQAGPFADADFLHPQPPQEQQGDFYQLLGDAWQWTGSAYLPYPGYRRVEGALGEYNGKFMINQMVLRGGSCATSRDHMRLSYRNFFKADKRWQFNGIRLAECV